MKTNFVEDFKKCKNPLKKETQINTKFTIVEENDNTFYDNFLNNLHKGKNGRKKSKFIKKNCPLSIYYIPEKGIEY